ncbi:hypothetical protein [Nonomuraea endophytica]|uniref:hypothetical protein n=1 Tax=Nonomuraea endophytica TaxID=714136 RepID=UPI0037C795E8
MRATLRTVIAGTAAVGTLFLTSGSAQAASVWAPPFKSCQNYVAFYIHSYDQMAGEAAMICNSTATIMRPQIAVFYGGRFYVKDKVCTFTTYCQTDRVYVPRQPGHWYTATNAGSAGSDFIWPEWAHARVRVHGGYRG